MTNYLKLIVPSTDLQAEYLDMLEDWKTTNEELVPWVLEFDVSNFPAMVEKLIGYSKGIGLKEGFVAHSTYWLVNEKNRILGAVNIRHDLNDSLRRVGGHIGYGIRPSERKKGYATEALNLALEISKTLGIEKALICCDKRNIGSARTIQKNGGVLESEELINGEIIQRYWINI